MPRVLDLIRDQSGFTASTDDIRVDYAGFLKGFDVALKGDLAATTTVTLGAFLDLLQPLEVKLNGVPFVSIRGTDLLALNCLFLGKTPIAIVGAAGEDDKISGLEVPVNAPAGIGMVHVRATRVAVTNLSGELLTLLKEELSAAPAGAARLKYTTLAYTPAASGSRLRAADLALEGALIGLLLYSTTIPTATADTVSADKLDLVIAGRIQERRNWQELTGPRKVGAYPEGTNILGVVDNYALWDLSEEPVPAGSRVELYINAGDTNAIRIIPIERIG